MPKLSWPIDGTASAFARSSSAVSSLLREEAEDVDPVVRDPVPREHEPHRERVGADEPQPRARPPVDVGPRAEQHGHPLARVVAADEDDRVLAVRRVGRRRDQHAVRDHLELQPREPPLRRRARLVGDGDPVVDPVQQEPPERAGRSASS